MDTRLLDTVRTCNVQMILLLLLLLEWINVDLLFLFSEIPMLSYVC